MDGSSKDVWTSLTLCMEIEELFLVYIEWAIAEL